MVDKHAILLVRVSGDKQYYESQILDLKQYAIEKGYTKFKTFATKETGFADFENKIGTNEMFKFIKDNPQYNCIFITELSRIGRRQSVLFQVKDILEKGKIQLFVKDSKYSLFNEDGEITSQGEIMFSMYGMFAEQEMKQKFERFSRRKRELMREGYSISGKVLFGYERKFDREKNRNKLIKDEINSKIVTQIFSWYLNGIDSIYKNPSIKRISLQCIKEGYHKYTHSKRNVNKLLKEEAYVGFKTTNNKRKNPKHGLNGLYDESPYIVSSFEIKYPLIINKDTFDAVQLKLKSNIINGDKDTKHITILSKLINCPSCGRKLSANYRVRDGGSSNSYRCTSRTDTFACLNKKSLSMNLIDSSVWSLLKSDLSSLSKKINEINPNIELEQINSQILNLNNKIIEIESEEKINHSRLSNAKKNKKINLLDYENSIINDLNNLDKERKKILNEVSKLESSKLLIDSRIKDLETIVNSNLPNIESSKELIKKYINSFVSKINVLQQDTRFTILEILLKDLNVSNYYEGFVEKFGDQFNIKSEFYYLVIDKKVTRDIHLYTTKLNITNSVVDSKNNFFMISYLPEILKSIENKTYAPSLEIENFLVNNQSKKEEYKTIWCSKITYKKLDFN